MKRLKKYEDEISKLKSAIRSHVNNNEELHKNINRLRSELLGSNVVKAAIEFAHSDWQCHEYCVKVAGHDELSNKFHAIVKEFLGIDMARAYDYGHLSYCYSRWKKNNE